MTIDFKFPWVCAVCLKDNAADCDICECGAGRTSIPTADVKPFFDELERVQRLL